MPGFVKCLDDSTLAIPDRRGNRRVDTFHNVLENPGVGLVFFVPGRRETLRVAGRAMIVRDFDVRSAMAEGGRIPELALVVAVEKAFFHCGKCITRSNLWNIEAVSRTSRDRCRPLRQRHESSSGGKPDRVGLDRSPAAL